MASSATACRDNWERLVAAVVKKEQIWQLCHQNSFSTISSDFSDGNLSFSSNSLRPISSSRSSSSRSSQLLLTNDYVVEDRKNASKTITEKLFSALLWRRKARDLGGISEEYYGLQSFSLRELLVATDNFSNKNVLGRGGHGTVYKGRLADGSLVAVKRLQEREIEMELEMANHVKHRNRNVIELRGFCITQVKTLLVYPFMKNGSVASWFGERLETQPPLSWPVRETIALGVAKGLAYLHHECIRGIIHGDVKAANILLDEDFQAVVANFTLAQFMDCDDCHIAPDYYVTGNCSEKADVFAYGTFLLELITGRRAIDLALLAKDMGMVLQDWLNDLYEKRMYEFDANPQQAWAFFLADLNPQLAFVGEEEANTMLQMALICMQDDPKDRPTMWEVVRMLEDGDGDGLVEKWTETLKNGRLQPLIMDLQVNVLRRRRSMTRMDHRR